MRRRATTALLLAIMALGLATAGCAASAEPAAGVPESASLAPADALAFVTVTADESSAQWEAAENLINRIPGARAGLIGALADELGDEGLTWKDDVAPALGPEVVVVVTADGKPIVFTKPDVGWRLDVLLAKSDTPLFHASIDGWAAIVEPQTDLDAYRAALERGTLAGDDALEAGFAALPDEAIARVWVDIAGLTPKLGRELGQASQQIDLGFDWLSAAVAVQEHGVEVAVGVRTPGGNGTEYEPELFAQVPSDAVAALSFGGTQELVDQIEDSIPLDDIADRVRSATGVSVEGILDAFSGEGMVYVRRGGDIPELTLVLAPPDADSVWQTLDDLAHTLARQSQTTVRTTTEGGKEVRIVEAQGVAVRYARLDGDTVIVTTGEQGIADFTGDGAKLVSSDAYGRAADEVGLDGRTGGFVYVDIDGLLPLIESMSGHALPADDRAAVEQLDSFILQSTRDGDTSTLSGFVRLND